MSAVLVTAKVAASMIVIVPTPAIEPALAPDGGEAHRLLLVENVVDTGMTLNYVVKTLKLRDQRSIAVCTLFYRPYRRLVDDIPLEHVGFTVPDELFAGYGLGLDERWRALPDLHVVVTAELPAALAAGEAA